ncbi:hypothetical protein NLU13_2485 [Sarocladium strictum]|uniref:Uncharacterized protein n=1 Tax=Sarocladium strictum TaxID=5046 RepID=A0AA39L9D6_SARSR|nr:hypothetical protein NLU13_2485 [Sarocladium strictum]
MPIITLSPAEESLVPRAEPHVITQTITRLTTTFTTAVTLGGGPTNYSGDEVEPKADIYGGSGDGSGLTNVQLGAIIGSSVAFVLILVITWCCMIQARRRLEAGESGSSDYSLTDSSRSSSPRSQSPRPRPPPRARVNIPGGPKFPTYRALPVRNPRANPSLRRTG